MEAGVTILAALCLSGYVFGSSVLFTGSHISAMPFPKLSDPIDPILAAYAEAVDALGAGYPPEAYVEHMRIPWRTFPGAAPSLRT